MYEETGPRKCKDVARALKVTLEELYTGAEKSIKLTRMRNCKTCKGTGSSKPEGITKCKSCDGNGSKIHIKKLGPGYVQQYQTTCNDCQGQGKTFDPKFLCEKCSGKKVFQETATLNIYIDKGMKENQKIICEGEADEQPDVLAGDVIFVIQQIPHQFERDGNDIYMKKQISLVSALTGVSFEFNHLDERKILVKSPKGEVIKPGQIKMLKGEGMPTYRDPFNKGNFYIMFEVIFPDTLSEKKFKWN